MGHPLCREEALLARRLKLADGRLAICYPHPDTVYCGKLLELLARNGILEFVDYGSTSIAGLRILGRGWSSNVFLAVKTDGGIVAVKALRPDSRRKTLLWEASVWSMASQAGVAPEIESVESLFIVYKPVIGPSIDEYTPANPLEREYVLRLVIDKAYILDVLGIAHNELARPKNHVILESCGRLVEPFIIDYESATLSAKPRNVSQLVGGLHRVRVFSKCIVDDRLRELLREYKSTISPRILVELREHLVMLCARE